MRAILKQKSVANIFTKTLKITVDLELHILLESKKSTCHASNYRYSNNINCIIITYTLKLKESIWLVSIINTLFNHSFIKCNIQIFKQATIAANLHFYIMNDQTTYHNVSDII